MQIRLITLGTVFIILTGVSSFSLASKNSKDSKIICVETSSEDEGTTPKEIGRVVVSLGKDGKATLVQINRSSIAALPAIHKTFSINSATIKHEAIEADIENPKANRNKKTETVTITDSKNRSFILKINDQSEIDWTGSSYFYEEGKIAFSTREESTGLTCEGNVMFPTTPPKQDIVSGK